MGRNGGRAFILVVLAAICLILDVNTAYAQAAQCAQLDNALDETMDASDPPAITQPGHGNDPAPSSGYDEEAERQRDDDARAAQKQPTIEHHPIHGATSTGRARNVSRVVILASSALAPARSP